MTQYNGYERGRSVPSPATLARIATALQTTPEELLNRGSAVSAHGKTHETVGAVLQRLRNPSALRSRPNSDSRPMKLVSALKTIKGNASMTEQEMKSLSRIAVATDPAAIEQTARNARGKSPIVEQAALRRLAEVSAMHDPGTVEHACWKMVHTV